MNVTLPPAGGSGSSSLAPMTGFDVTWVTSPIVRYAAGICVVGACVITIQEIQTHVQRYDFPRIQVYVLRILLMVPFYCIMSYSSILIPSMRFFLVTIRDTYEAFVLYMFFSLLIAYCGGEGTLLRSLGAKRYKGIHVWPLCWLPMYPLDTAFFLRCKRWVLQYALIKPTSSFLACVFEPVGVYRESEFGWGNLYTYICIICNFSISYSLYYLVLFDVEVEKELRYCKPLLKFVCIKSIIFFSFWQSVTVSVLISMGWLYTGDSPEERERVSATLQDILMCFELLPVALLHHLAFGRDKLDDEMAAEPQYGVDTKKNVSAAKNFDEALSLEDVIEDTFATIFYRRGKLVDQEGDEGEEESGSNAADRHIHVQAGGAALLRDPTVEELVTYAVINDKGTRADGFLHYDEDSEREENNRDLFYTDTDVITRRHKGGEGQGAQVSMDKVVAGPAIYCIVCGRFDREMVRRHSGYKCKECVGNKGKSVLKEKQKEKHAEDNDGSCVVCGRKDRPMVRRGQGFKCIGCL